MIDFARHTFHPVIRLPKEYEVYDFTRGYDPHRVTELPFGIGRYDEDRRGMYTAELFQDAAGARTIHMGIDIGAPAGTEVLACFPGEIFLFADNPAPGDYGPTVITRHILGSEALFVLHGHLSRRSLEGKRRGTRFQAGELLGWVGEKSENGGWNPHLHFQLSLREPKVCDMPGVVSLLQRAEALAVYPDPRLVLGPLY